MQAISSRGVILLIVGCVFCMMLNVVSLPSYLQIVRPDFLLLALIFWVLLAPYRINIFIGWCLGLLMDVLTDSVLGMHALVYTLILYIVIKIHRRLLLFPVWQQAAAIFVMFLCAQMIQAWLQHASGVGGSFWLIVLPALSGALGWFGLARLLN
jgi:rod shape-determining protein MreD